MRVLLKAMATTAGATVIGQALALVTNKILVQTLGASGIGFYSLLRQIQDTGTVAGTLSVGGLVQGCRADMVGAGTQRAGQRFHRATPVPMRFNPAPSAPGDHHGSLSRYQRTVAARPAAKSMRGRQPSSRCSLDESMA